MEINMKTCITNRKGILYQLLSFPGIALNLIFILNAVAFSQQSPMPVNLGLTGGFAILSYAGITNTGPTIITGNVGVSPLTGASMTGFGMPNIVGTIYTVDASGPTGSMAFPAMLTQAMLDLTTAFNDANGRTVNPVAVSGNIGGQTLYPNLYKSIGALEITSGDLTLDAQGDGNAVWIFQIASGFNMTTGRQIFLTNNAKASNVYWQVGSAATFGTNCIMKGTIMAFTKITFATGASLEGRALALTESVTLESNTIGGTASSPIDAEVFLGSAANFKILAGSKISNTGLTVVNGDIGVSPSSTIIGFPPGTLTGVRYPGDATSAAAQLDLKAAYDSISARKVDSTITTQLGGTTHNPGVYKSSSGTFGITDTLTLNGGGSASAVWIFTMTDALTTASGSYVKLVNGAQWYNVFWQVGSSANLGSSSKFSGNLIALSSIITNNGASINGRLLARTDSVSLTNTNIGGDLSTPVELTSFKGELHNGIVSLKWQTATETNNRGFDIERNNGGGWIMLAFIPGNGTNTKISNYSYSDNPGKTGKYQYRLKQIDFNGNETLSSEIEINLNNSPAVYYMAQNFPNPFNPTSMIRYEIPFDSKVIIKIFNVIGNEVSMLVNENISAGNYEVQFNAKDLPSGVYFYSIKAVSTDGKINFSNVKKMVLMK
jgi:hypothetical protein